MIDKLETVQAKMMEEQNGERINSKNMERVSTIKEIICIYD